MSRTAALSDGPWIERRPPGPVMAPTYLNAADDFLSTFSISLAKSLGASRRWFRGAATLVFPEKSCVRLVDISGPLQLTLDRSSPFRSAQLNTWRLRLVHRHGLCAVRVGCWLGEVAAYRVEVLIRVARVDVVPMLAIVLSLCLVEVLSRRRTRLGSSGIISVVDFIPLQMCVDYVAGGDVVERGRTLKISRVPCQASSFSRLSLSFSFFLSTTHSSAQHHHDHHRQSSHQHASGCPL